MSKITIQNEDGTISIETNENVDSIEDFINYLVIPVLKGLQYSDFTISEHIRTSFTYNKRERKAYNKAMEELLK